MRRVDGAPLHEPDDEVEEEVAAEPRGDAPHEDLAVVRPGARRGHVPRQPGPLPGDDGRVCPEPAPNSVVGGRPPRAVHVEQGGRHEQHLEVEDGGVALERRLGVIQEGVDDSVVEEPPHGELVAGPPAVPLAVHVRDLQLWLVELRDVEPAKPRHKPGAPLLLAFLLLLCKRVPKLGRAVVLDALLQELLTVGRAPPPGDRVHRGVVGVPPTQSREGAADPVAVALELH
mmetsp:Transcript_13703/g.40453  ORF Transcript_13703/g.40453 Transcript_13703/m.40453 type:complete len:230 (+) Transcript_13703:570-1259(+)